MQACLRMWLEGGFEVIGFYYSQWNSRLDFTHSDIVGANEGKETKALLDVSRLEHRLQLKRCCCCWSELDSEEGWNYFVILRLVIVTWATFNFNEFLRREIKKKTLKTKKWETRTQTTKKERNKVKGQPEMHLDLVLCFVFNLIWHLFWIWSHIFVWILYVLNLISHSRLNCEIHMLLFQLL